MLVCVGKKKKKKRNKIVLNEENISMLKVPRRDAMVGQGPCWHDTGIMQRPTWLDVEVGPGP